MTPTRMAEFQDARTTAETAAKSVIMNAASEETTLVAKALLDAYAMVDALLAEAADRILAMAAASASVMRLKMRATVIEANLDAALKGEP